MEVQYISLNMTPTGVNPRFHISQYDVGRLLGFHVYNGSEVVDLDSYTCTIEATRTDGTQITADVITTDNQGVFAVTAEMSNEADKYTCQLVVIDSNANRIASLPFVMDVITAALNGNAESISEDRTLYQQYNAAMQAALANEANNRINADNLEKVTRQSAIDALQNNIDAEATARENAITAEATARENADTSLNAAIEAEETARINADDTLQSNITSEATARANADASLRQAIDAMVSPSGQSVVVDSSLSISGAAADAKVTGNKISELNNHLGSLNTIFNGALFDYKYNLLTGRIWVHGSWSSSSPTDVNNRIRTEIINIGGLPSTFPVEIADGYLWNYYAFDGAYVGAGSDWKQTGDFNFSQHGNPTKISILVRREDNAEITDINDVASKINIEFGLFDPFYKDLRMIENGSLSEYRNAEGFYGCNSTNISNITDLPSNISTGFILRNEQIKLSDTTAFGTFQTIQSRRGEIATRFITTSGAVDDWTILRTKSIEMISIGDSIPLGTYSWVDESAQWGHSSAVDTKVSYVQQMCNIKGIINKNYCHGGLGWLRPANDETLLKPLLDSIDFTSANYVYIQLGTNDWNYSFALGETTDTKDTDTVCGHIRYAIEYIYDKNPLIKLCIALPFNRAPGGSSYRYNWGYGALNSLSKTLKDYCDVIKNICDEYGVQYIDWTTNSAIGRLNIQSMLPDGTHPSIQAHEILGHELAGRIPFN